MVYKESNMYITVNNIYFIYGVLGILTEKGIVPTLTGKVDGNVLCGKLITLYAKLEAEDQLDDVAKNLPVREIAALEALYSESELTPLIQSTALTDVIALLDTAGVDVILVERNDAGALTFRAPELNDLIELASKHGEGVAENTQQKVASTAQLTTGQILKWKPLKDKIEHLPLKGEIAHVNLDDLQGVVDAVNRAAAYLVDGISDHAPTIADITLVRNIVNTPPLDFYAQEIFDLGAPNKDIKDDVIIELTYTVMPLSESVTWDIPSKHEEAEK